MVSPQKNCELFDCMCTCTTVTILNNFKEMISMKSSSRFHVKYNMKHMSHYVKCFQKNSNLDQFQDVQ